MYMRAHGIYLARLNQFTAGNNNNYGGSNFYTWTSSATMYNQIKNINQMEEQATKTSGTDQTAYSALGKFLKSILLYLVYATGGRHSNDRGRKWIGESYSQI